MSFISNLFRTKYPPTDTQEIPALLEADLHCHLLPNWDDGPRSLDESLLMAANAANHGVKRIVVTPHVGRSFGGRPERPAHEIPAAVANLQRIIHDHEIALDLLPGAEIILSVPNIEERVKLEPWLTVGGHGRYILIESPFDIWPKNVDQLLFHISLQGITPIIAHPERLIDVQEDIGIMKPLVERGALLQLTAQSVFGTNRRRAQCCQKLLTAGLVGLIASDAHNSKRLLPTEIVTPLREFIGEESAHRILIENPLAVINGESIKGF